MGMHPLKRLPDVANMFGLFLASVFVLLETKNIWAKGVGLVSSFIFLILSLLYLYLTIRDYVNQYPKYTCKLFGINFLKY